MAAAAAASISNVGGGQDGLLLRYKFRAGQVDRYSVSVRVEVDAPPEIGELNARTVRASGGTTLRVVKVNADGSAVVRAEVEPLRVRGSRPDPTLSTQIVTLRMTPRGESPAGKLVRGRAVSPKDLLVDPSALSRLAAVLPAAPVKPGDRWTFQAPNPFQPAGKITVNSRYFAADSVEGTPTARIHQTMSIPIALRLLPPKGGGTVRVHGALKVNSAIQFAPSLGKVVRSSASGSGALRLTPAGDRTGKESVTLTLNVDAVSELID